MLLEKLKKFILIAKKLMVLKKVESDQTEPKVSIVINPSGEVLYTFISSVFPFFSFPFFENVKEAELDLFLYKCENYLQNYEKNYNIVIPGTKQDTKVFGKSMLISKDGELIRYTVSRKEKFRNKEERSDTYCKLIKEKICLWEKFMFL